MRRAVFAVTALLLLTCCAAAEQGHPHEDEEVEEPMRESDELNQRIAQKDYEAFLQELAKEGIDVNQPDSEGRLPLMQAVRTGDLRLVDALIQHGALANSHDPHAKITPVQYALEHDLLDVARVLLEYGADLNVTDEQTSLKPRMFARSAATKALVAQWDVAGPQAFEEPPGTWVHATHDNGARFWLNLRTNEGRWNTPPSCAWQQVEFQGQPHMYVNYVTSQTVHQMPAALAWRLISHGGRELWFNYKANITQEDQPGELPDELAASLRQLKNVRWFNNRTGQLSWEDPKHQTPWRELKDDAGEKYWVNVVTGATTHEAPEELAWVKMADEAKPGAHFWHNTRTQAKTWELPHMHAWERHDSDL